MRKKSSQTDRNGRENASIIALNFIGFLAEDEDRLRRFCTHTGLASGDLRESIGEAAFQAMALDYALNDEALLLAFAAGAKLDPQAIVAARRFLPGYAE